MAKDLSTCMNGCHLFCPQSFQNFNLASSIKFSSLLCPVPNFLLKYMAMQLSLIWSSSKMSHPFEVLLRVTRQAGFAEGLKTGCEELANMQKYVKWLKDQLHREGNWQVANVARTENVNIPQTASKSMVDNGGWC